MGNTLGATLSRHQDDGIKAIKDLMEYHHQVIAQDISEIKNAAAKRDDEIFPRLNKIESRVTVIETAIGPQGISGKIKNAIDDNEHVKWVGETRKHLSGLKWAIITAVIFSIGGMIWGAQVLFAKAEAIINNAQHTQKTK
jgi:hypothetical protein